MVSGGARTRSSVFLACLLFASTVTQICLASEESLETRNLLQTKKERKRKDDKEEKKVEADLGPITDEAEPEAEAPGPEPEIIEKLCSGEVLFFLDAKFNWTADRHPVNFPKKARWSPLYGAVHNDLYEMYSYHDGNSIASKAVEEVAEKGTAKLLKKEVEECIEEGNCREFLQYECDEKVGDCRMEGNFTVNSTYPYVTFISKADPSPDWFAGVASLNLCNDGAWLPGVNIPLNASDAGTDAGTTFTAEEIDIKPKDRVNITELDVLNTTNPFYDPDHVPVAGEDGEEEEGGDEEVVIGRLAEVVEFSLTQDAETAELDVSGTGGAVAISVETDDLTEEELEELAKEEAKIRIIGPENGDISSRSGFFWVVSVLWILSMWILS